MFNEHTHTQSSPSLRSAELLGGVSGTAASSTEEDAAGGRWPARPGPLRRLQSGPDQALVFLPQTPVISTQTDLPDARLSYPHPAKTLQRTNLDSLPVRPFFVSASLWTQTQFSYCCSMWVIQRRETGALTAPGVGPSTQRWEAEPQPFDPRRRHHSWACLHILQPRPNQSDSGPAEEFHLRLRAPGLAMFAS